MDYEEKGYVNDDEEEMEEAVVICISLPRSTNWYTTRTHGVYH